MSMHLQSQDLVDALDGALDASRRAHLDSCAVCRDEVHELRAVLSDAGPAGAVPEPSPLFWDHLSARVREATADAQPYAPTSWRTPVWRPIAALAAAAVVLAALVVFRTGPVPERGAAIQQAGIESGWLDPLPEDLESSLAFMSAAASELSLEEARAVDLAPAPRIVDGAIERLTIAQRAELVKLIREDLRSMN
jgi:hypothetical protein